MDVKLKCHIGSARLWPKGLEGYTEDISRNGISVFSNGGTRAADVPRVGELVTVEVELPANHGFGRKCIHCQATVLRVSEENDGVRIAFGINYMKFRDVGEESGAGQPASPDVRRRDGNGVLTGPLE